MGPYPLSTLIVGKIEKAKPEQPPPPRQAAPTGLADPVRQPFRPVDDKQPAQLSPVTPGQRAFDHGESAALWIQVLQYVLLKEGAQAHRNAGRSQFQGGFRFLHLSVSVRLYQVGFQKSTSGLGATSRVAIQATLGTEAPPCQGTCTEPRVEYTYDT